MSILFIHASTPWDLSHTDLIFRITCLSLSLPDSLSHTLIQHFRLRSYLGCFSRVKITFALTGKGRSIPGVELKPGWGRLLSGIHSHSTLPWSCEFASHVFTNSGHNQHCGLPSIFFMLVSSFLFIFSYLMWYILRAPRNQNHHIFNRHIH